MKNTECLPKKISIFPLSNFIIFPNTSVPLNIFEPRYIEMINDSMKNERIIGMIQPKKQQTNKQDEDEVQEFFAAFNDRIPLKVDQIDTTINQLRSAYERWKKDLNSRLLE